MTDTTPRCYLTRYAPMGDAGRVTWTVIYQALPICVDKYSRAEAEAAARQMKVSPSAVWDAHTGHFFPLDTFN